MESINKKKKASKMKVISLALCLFVCGCNIPLTFWEEEGIKVAEDVVQEEKEVLENPPAPVQKPKEHPKGDKKVKKVVLKRFAHEIKIMNNDDVEIVTHHCSKDPFAPCP